jgi:hypothetical protein
MVDPSGVEAMVNPSGVQAMVDPSGDQAKVDPRRSFLRRFRNSNNTEASSSGMCESNLQLQIPVSLVCYKLTMICWFAWILGLL